MLQRPTPANRLRRTLMWSVIVAIVAAPLLAMQFTSEVDWTGSDFLFAAILLGGGGLHYELVAARASSPVARGIGAAAILGVVLVVWADGAVGII